MEKHKIISKKFKSKKKIEENEEEEEEAGNELVSVEDNHIYFYDSVTTKSILTLIKHIQTLNKNLLFQQRDIKIKYDIDVEFNIYLHINSCGGYISDAFAALKYIEQSKIPIISIIDGFAASAATILSIVCYKRQITSFSSMLIHQLSGGCCGTYEQLEDEHENNIYLENSIKKIYIKYTNGKLTNKILEKVLKHDLMWDAAKCLQYGLVDEIV